MTSNVLSVRASMQWLQTLDIHSTLVNSPQCPFIQILVHGLCYSSQKGANYYRSQKHQRPDSLLTTPKITSSYIFHFQNQPKQKKYQQFAYITRSHKLIHKKFKLLFETYTVDKLRWNYMFKPYLSPRIWPLFLNISLSKQTHSAKWIFFSTHNICVS